MFLFLLKRFIFNSNYAVVLQTHNFPNISKIQVKLNIKKKISKSLRELYANARMKMDSWTPERLLTCSCVVQSEAPFTNAPTCHRVLSGSISSKVETHRFPLGKGRHFYFNLVF